MSRAQPFNLNVTATRNCVFCHWKALLIGAMLFFIVGSLLLLLKSKADASNRKHRMQRVVTMLLSNNFSGDVVVDGKSLWSWRSPLLDKNAPTPTPKDRTIPWNHDSNLAYSSRSPIWFCDGDDNHTHIVAVRGDGSFFDTYANKTLNGNYNHSSLSVLVELHDSKFPWSCPADLLIDNRSAQDGFHPIQLTSLKSQKSDYLIAFGDGEVWLISRNTPLQALQPFMSNRSLGDYNRDVHLAPYRK